MSTADSAAQAATGTSVPDTSAPGRLAPGTFTPRPGAAPLSSQIRAQALMEAKLILRNGEQLLLAVVIPILALVGSVMVLSRSSVELPIPGRAVDVVTPGVLALALMSTGFTSVAIATGFERRYGLLKRLGASPLPRSGLLGGKILALLGVQVFQLVVLGLVAALLGWQPTPGAFGVPALVAATLLGTAAFASLGLAMAGTLRAEATLAAANLVYLLLLIGGAVVLPYDSYGAAGQVLRYLPSAALGDAFRAALIHGAFAWIPLAILAAWAALGTVLATRYFKWE